MEIRVEEIIGKRVRQAREEAGVSQRAFGEALEGVLGTTWTPQAVSQAENGKRDWRARDLVAVSWVLKRPVEWFYSPMEEDRGKQLDGFPIQAGEIAGEGWATAELEQIRAMTKEMQERLEAAEKRQAERGWM
jgi:transcriptional regulator with XRE-family HTH domain